MTRHLRIATARRVIEVLFPVGHAVPETELGEHPSVTAARAAEPWISGAALLAGLGIIVMMLVRILIAWAQGRL
ncbi:MULTISPECIES: hypothetical protein [unclassified Sphingomonas]|uniref:hypothetical protein n=1 Tax=unclassified Sphingomonas TaxID=196159 RepID=UPI00092AB5CC|nr:MULTISPECIES: hypothetical protein [unclassified Sphingomonas]MBN8848177.1 hypothetical protein [Sphingomonas sp.]OJV30671.1 MAG: hypothetical protein BGO24_08120 [Sphingomonas sp. 67-36]